MTLQDYIQRCHYQHIDTLTAIVALAQGFVQEVPSPNTLSPYDPYHISEIWGAPKEQAIEENAVCRFFFTLSTPNRFISFRDTSIFASTPKGQEGTCDYPECKAPVTCTVTTIGPPPKVACYLCKAHLNAWLNGETL